MSVDMAKPRIRLIIDLKDQFRRAVQIRAAAQDRSPSEVLEDIIKREFRKEIAQARQAMKEEGKDPDWDANDPDDKSEED